MATTFKVHSAYNAQDIVRDTEGKPVRVDGKPIADKSSRYYDHRSNKSPIPHSIVILQKEENFAEAGSLPELLTAKGIKNLSKVFPDLMAIGDVDYPKGQVFGSSRTTQSGVECIEYYYKYSVPREVEM